MPTRKEVYRRRKFFSLIVTLMFVLSSILICFPLPLSTVSASSVSHNIGNLKVYGLNDHGNIRLPIQWQGEYQSTIDTSAITYIGLVIDQDNYNHIPGSIDIADCFGTYSYGSQDDFTRVIDAKMIIDDGTTQKSIASYQNTGTADPNDIYINQTAWSVKDKDWFMIQWNLTNLKGVDLTGVCLGLELSLSQVGAGLGGGVGGDSGDDVDGFDFGSATYYVQDNGGSGTCLGFASAAVKEPITHFYSHDYNTTFDKTIYENETWLYERLHKPNSVVGGAPGNRTSTVGWNDFVIPAGSYKNFTLVMAIDDTFDDMIIAVEDAQQYYRYKTTGFRITEFSDSSSASQKIEIFNFGREPTDLDAEGYFLSVDGGTSPLTGSWSINPLPTNEHTIFTVTGGTIGPESGRIGLYQDINGKVVLADVVAFGQEGVAPDPLSGESVERRYDTGSASYINFWLRNASTGPSFGTQNDVPDINSSSQVVLNEVMFNPGLPQHGFVELMYTGGGSLDIQGYSIICDSEYKITTSNVLSATEPYFILSQSLDPNFFNQMDSFGDNVYLYDDAGRLLDMVGWSSSHNVNKSVVRVPEGFGGHWGYDDTTSISEGWVFDQNPSAPLVNIGSDQFQIGVPGMTISYYLTVTNGNDVDDVIDISHSSIKGWSVQLLQADGVTPLTDTETGPAQDGIPDTGTIGPYSFVQIVVNVTIPFGIPGGVSEYTTILATSTANPWATESALLNSSTLMGLEYRSPNRYVTFVRGTLMVIGHVDNTFVKITDLSNGNQLAQFTIDEGESWTTNLNDAHVDINASHNATVLSGNSLYTSGANSWMSYIPTDGGQKYGTLFYGFVPAEMYIFAPRLNTLPPTSISITDISDGDDTTVLRNANADFTNSDVEIYRLTGFDDDVVKIQSNVQISVLAGKTSDGVDWTATPPSVNGSELGKHFFVFASDDLTILPIENNTRVNIIDLSDSDDSRTQVMNRFDILTQRSVSPTGGNPIVTRPGVTLYHKSDNLIDDDYLEVVADKDVLVYIGPISDQREEFADLSPSVSTGIFSQEVFTYAQNGGANDLQVFVYDKNHTVVKITSLTYSWGPGTGRDSFFDFILDSDDLMGTGPWWWEWGGWGGNLLHIQSNLPISVFNGDFDGASFGSFLSVINPPENLKYPDVVISQGDISFDPDSVVTEGTLVKINATAHNFGEVNITDIKVSFYNGDPSLGGILIGSNITIPFLDVGYNDTVTMTWLPPSSGIYNIYVALDYPSPGQIIEIDETNNLAFRILEVLPISPPELYLKAIGNDIVLNWTQASIRGISYYLIYRSTSQTEFDFFVPWVDTSNVLANGIDPVDKQIIPLRTTWNDTGSASGSAPHEYYYIIRTVFDSGKISHTSRTVGKYTRIFSPGISTFSLPLKPLKRMWTDDYTNEMNADYIRYMNSATHVWITHDKGDGGFNNILMEVGKGYEVCFQNTTNYTFTGMPGAMILYDDVPFGFDTDPSVGDADSLTASVDKVTGTVTLNWDQPANLGFGDGYYVLRSIKRDGFWGASGGDYIHLASLAFNVLSYQDIGNASSGTEYYYMIVPVNLSTGERGIASYSLGVWTARFLTQYDTFALPLKPSINKTADWFCDNIPDTVGINFYNVSAQRWSWHSTRMPQEAYDPDVVMNEGYQISTSTTTKYAFIGI